MKIRNKFWRLYDVVLTFLSLVVAMAFLLGLVIGGIGMYTKYLLIPIFNNIYMLLCAIRILARIKELN